MVADAVWGIVAFVVVIVVVYALLKREGKNAPEVGRQIGRFWGEVRKGKMEVEAEIRQMAAETKGVTDATKPN